MDRPSPLQNRVAPDGALHAVAERGMLMGNRGGRLHGPDSRLGRRRWASRAWICCEIAFRDRRRTVMGAGYTELFFLDEATALAAGHRPCFECRRAEARAFAAALSGAPQRAPEIDRLLHADRLGPRQETDPAGLPVGAMAAVDGAAFLILDGRSLRWSFAGYGPPAPLPPRAVLLTPPATVGALRAGYRPRLHDSVLR
jgi:hypothetical protein